MEPQNVRTKLQNIMLRNKGKVFQSSGKKKKKTSHGNCVTVNGSSPRDILCLTDFVSPFI